MSGLMSAEGASLKQAKPDETLRQKDPAPVLTLENSPQKITARNTDGVNLFSWLVR